MIFTIGLIILTCYIVLIALYMSRSKKEITCKNCGHKYIVVPKRVLSNMYLLQAIGLTIGIMTLGLGNDFTFSLFLALLGFYYLFKKEGYKCYNCKTVNNIS